MLDTVWVFHGEGGRFSSGVFTSIEKAEIGIERNIIMKMELGMIDLRILFPVTVKVFVNLISVA